MGQQLAQSIGIGLAAILLGLIQGLHHSTTLKAADVSPAFVLIGVLSLAGLFFFVPLSKEAGAEVSGKVERPGHAPLMAHAAHAED
jgi:hypothetical protein